MYKARLKHKVSGEIVDCRVYHKIGEDDTYYNPDDPRETYNIEDYEIIPLMPYELFGVECGQGWRELYNPIFKYIEEYNKDKPDGEKIRPLQVKEKWAHLEFYTNFVTKELGDMIDKAYEESENICEECGSHKNVGMVIGSYYYVTCLDCLVKSLKENGGVKCWYSNDDKKKYWVYSDGHKELCNEKFP